MLNDKTVKSVKNTNSMCLTVQNIIYQGYLNVDQV